MTVTTATYPVAPTTTPAKGTLLDAATVSGNFAWMDGVGLFDSYNCMTFQSMLDFCQPDASKDFSQVAGWQNGFRFAAYGGVTCKAPGLDLSHQKAEVGRVFEAGESTAVEQALMATRFVDDAGSLWGATPDITPAGGAVKPAVGVALLEAYARDKYVGAPTLHLPVVIASLALTGNTAQWDGNILRTILGSKVALGAGYDYPNLSPTGAAAATGEKWVYATGEVVVLKGPLEVRQATNFSNNEVYVMGERPYVVAVDCFTAAIKVQVST